MPSDYTEENAEQTPPVIAGDYRDDDALYIDDLVESDPTPPTPDELPMEKADLPISAQKIPNRMVNRTVITTGPLSQPIMVLPADVNRKQLVIVSEQPIWVASEISHLTATNAPIGGFIAANASTRIPDFTGAVWIVSDPTINAGTTWRAGITTVTE